MSKLAVWTCCSVIASLVMVTWSYPENTESQIPIDPLQYSLTSMNLNSDRGVGYQGAFPIYNPSLMTSNENEATRDKRHLFKKKKDKKAKKGGYYQQNQAPPVIIINEYRGGHGGYGGGHGGPHYGGGGGWSRLHDLGGSYGHQNTHDNYNSGYGVLQPRQQAYGR